MHVDHSSLVHQGGQLIWIAPSGGRDRPKSGRWTPDPFDPSAVELMRQLGAKAKPACHFYPVAMHTGEMMPPPTATESTLGEERVTKHVPVGESCSAVRVFPRAGRGCMCLHAPVWVPCEDCGEDGIYERGSKPTGPCSDSGPCQGWSMVIYLFRGLIYGHAAKQTQAHLLSSLSLPSVTADDFSWGSTHMELT